MDIKKYFLNWILSQIMDMDTSDDRTLLRAA